MGCALKKTIGTIALQKTNDRDDRIGVDRLSQSKSILLRVDFVMEHAPKKTIGTIALA